MTRPTTLPPLASANALPAPAARRRLAGKLLAALIMGLILLALSGIIYSAAAAGLASPWSYLWLSWLAAGAAALAVALAAPTAKHAWSRLCLLDAATAIVVFLVALLAAPRAAGMNGANWVGAPHPLGAALGAALLSGFLGLFAVILALLLLAVAWLLHHRHA